MRNTLAAAADKTQKSSSVDAAPALSAMRQAGAALTRAEAAIAASDRAAVDRTVEQIRTAAATLDGPQGARPVR